MSVKHKYSWTLFSTFLGYQTDYQKQNGFIPTTLLDHHPQNATSTIGKCLNVKCLSQTLMQWCYFESLWNLGDSDLTRRNLSLVRGGEICFQVQLELSASWLPSKECMDTRIPSYTKLLQQLCFQMNSLNHEFNTNSSFFFSGFCQIFGHGDIKVTHTAPHIYC